MSNDDKRLVYVCEGSDCGGKGSLALADRLRETLAARADVSPTEVRTYPCFGGCGHGINVVVHPERCFLSGVTEADLPELADALAKGVRIERLCGKVERDVEEIAFDLVAMGF
jgi:NADH:ubiquinone oxidoreductase subunit E